MQFGLGSVTEALGNLSGLLHNKEITFNSDVAQTDTFLADAEVLVVSNPVDLSDLATRAPALKWVHVMSAGVEKVVADIPPGVLLTNVKGAHADRAGEFGITAILMLNNRIPAFATQQQNRIWQQSPQSVVMGKTVTILGLGALGGATARFAKLFGMHVVGVTRTGRPHEHADEVHRLDEVGPLLERTDFLVIALPLTPETDGLLTRALLDRLPAHAGLLNIGRANVLDHDALVEKLKDGSLSGAVLDVFLEEPLPAASELWSTPNLFITPHNGLDDPGDFGRKCLEIFASNLAAYSSGRPLLTQVDLEAGY